MVYKKYVKQDGKTYGPYYYESVRGQDGKIHAVYLGTDDPANKVPKESPKLPPGFGKIILISLALIAVIALLLFSGLPTGMISGQTKISPSVLQVIDSSGTPIRANIQLSKNNIIVKELESPIGRIKFQDLQTENGLQLGIDDVEDNQGWAELYAIDPSSLEFTEAEVTVTAKGNSLYKCSSWDFEAQECLVEAVDCTPDPDEPGSELCDYAGGWEYVMEITPGEEYTFALTQDDPGFAEGSPSTGTADNGNYIFITSENDYETSGGDYTDTWSDDSSYFCTGYHNSDPGGDNRWYTYFDFNISNLSINSLDGLTFEWRGYATGDDTTCGPTNDNPECVSNGDCEPSYIRVYDWSSDQWDTLSSSSYTLTNAWDTNQQTITRSNSAPEQSWYNNTTGIVRVAFEHYETSMSNNYETYIITDFAQLTVEYITGTPPTVVALAPAPGSNFDPSDIVEIAANVTDSDGVDTVLANITLPNSTTVQLELSQVGATNKYNNSYTVPTLMGTYNIRFIANDTNGSVNDGETTNFKVLPIVITDPVRSGGAFLLYVPPIHDPGCCPPGDPEVPILVVTAFVDNTSLYIEDLDGDGDSDDSVGNDTNRIVLDQGESRIVFIPNGTDTDIDDGDYFYIDSNKVITVSVMAKSAWNARTVAAEGRKYSGEEYFIYSRYDPDSNTSMDMVIFAHEDRTHFRIYDITGNTTNNDGIDANYTTVIGEGNLVNDVVLDEGEHLSYIGEPFIPGGHTIEVISNKDLGIIVGSFTENNNGRDGGFYVGGVDGKTAATEFYTYVGKGGGAGDEDEMYFFDNNEVSDVVVDAYYANGTLNETFSFQLNSSNNYHYKLLNTGSAPYKHITSSAPISILAGTWIEAGTGDIADFAPTIQGGGIGRDFNIYVPDPATRGYTNAIILAYDNNTFVEIVNTSNGYYFGNRTLNSKEHWNFNVTYDTLLTITATKNIAVEVTNYDDNIAFTAASLPFRKLMVDITSDKDEIEEGDYVTFYINVSNPYDVDFYNIVVTDILENSLLYVNSTSSAGVSGPTILYNTPAENETTLVWNMSTLPAEESILITLVVEVNSSDLIQRKHVSAEGVDGDNNTVGGSDVSILFMADNLPPSITNVTDTPDPQLLNNIVNITCVVTDDWWVSEVVVEINGTNYTMTEYAEDQYYYEYNGTSVGLYDFIIYATDSSGNTANSGIHTFRIANELLPPGFTEVQPQGETYNQTDTVPFLVGINENVTVYANVSWDATWQIVNLTYNGTDWYYETNFTNTSWPGRYNVTFIVTDPSSNSNNTTTYFFVQDVTPPLVLDVLPQGATYNQNDQVPISANVTDPYYNDPSTMTVIATVNWDATSQVVSLSYNNITGLWEGNFTNTSTTDTYTFIVIASDQAVNVNATEGGSFIIADSAIPIINLVTDTPDPVNQSGVITITANITDNVAVDTVFFSIDGGANQSPTGSAGNLYWYTGADTSVVGPHTYTVYANDTSGNNAVPAPGTYTVQDSTPPNVNLEGPLDNSHDPDGSIVFQYNVNDTDSGIAYCELIINGVVQQTDQNVTEGITQQFLVSGLPNGNYTWSVNCTDNSTNSNEGSHFPAWVVQVLVNRGVDISGPGTKTVTKNTNAVYKLTVTNLGSTIDDFTLSVANLNGVFSATLNQTNISNLAANSSAKVTLTVFDTAVGIFDVKVTATSATNASIWDSLTTQTLFVKGGDGNGGGGGGGGGGSGGGSEEEPEEEVVENVTGELPVLPLFEDVELEISSPGTVNLKDNSFPLALTVRNTGEAALDNLAININLPEGWYHVGVPSISLEPGEALETEIPVYSELCTLRSSSSYVTNYLELDEIEITGTVSNGAVSDYDSAKSVIIAPRFFVTTEPGTENLVACIVINNRGMPAEEKLEVELNLNKGKSTGFVELVGPYRLVRADEVVVTAQEYKTRWMKPGIYELHASLYQGGNLFKKTYKLEESKTEVEIR